MYEARFFSPTFLLLVVQLISMLDESRGIARFIFMYVNVDLMINLTRIEAIGCKTLIDLLILYFNSIYTSVDHSKFERIEYFDDLDV